jgi:hypothetical protein
MPIIHETKVSLRFSGDDLKPQEITERLGAKPTSALLKGEARRSGHPSRSGIWRLRVEPAAPGEEFADQIIRLFEMLTPDEETWRDLTERFKGDLFVGLFLASNNEGLSIPADVVKAIAARGLELGFDIYPEMLDD